MKLLCTHLEEMMVLYYMFTSQQLLFPLNWLHLLLDMQQLLHITLLLYNCHLLMSCP